MKLTQEELDMVIVRHERWLCRDTIPSPNNCGRADFSHVDLSGLRLTHALLNGAIFDHATLIETDFGGARLIEASFKHAAMSGANLYGADLRGADLNGASLLCCCLDCSNLAGANLRNAYLDHEERSRCGEILREPIFGYKKTDEGVVITAEIPAGAIVFGINKRKYRTNRAKITNMGGEKVLHSRWSSQFEYRLGQEIEIPNFDLQYNKECATGFHFFKTREEAESY